MLLQFQTDPVDAADRSPREIQKALTDQGFSPGAADGVWGKKSIVALKAFQKAHGLDPTGVIDTKSIEQLFHKPIVPAVSDAAFGGRDAPPADNQSVPSAAAPTEAISVAPAAQNFSIDPAPVSQSAPQSPVQTPASGSSSQSPSLPQGNPTPAANTPSSPTEVQDKGADLVIFESLVAALAMAGTIFVLRRKSKRKLLPTGSEEESRQTRPHAGLAYEKPTAAQPDADISSAVPVMATHGPTTAAETVTGLKTSLEVHDAAVREWISERASKPTAAEVSRPVTASQPVAPPESEEIKRSQSPQIQSMKASLEAHDASIKGWFAKRTTTPKESYEPAHAKKAEIDPKSGWVSSSTHVTIGSTVITRGLIYVGSSLRKRGSAEDENCLINPKLSVGRTGDTAGHTMGYWPSYSAIRPEARRSYIDWLASPRSDPSTYIGYVFLYFYGLERRLMLEPNAPDRAEVLAEVRRLFSIYGGNGSFHRYASDLLNAAELQNSEPSVSFINVEANGYEVPSVIQVALGHRVRDGRDIEPELLLSFAMTHPETRVRTPARRAPELLKALFEVEYKKTYPNGLRIKGSNFKSIRKRYRACSASFEIDIPVHGGAIPDITGRAEPITTARRIFDYCSDQLDDYSRALGRLPGLTPNLPAISKLPASLRPNAAASLKENPLAKFDLFARAMQPITVSDLATLAEHNVGALPSKPKLRELSQLVAAFGYGVTCDPAFASKNAAADDHVILFKLADESLREPGEAFRQAQLGLMLGVMVAHADGHFHELERKALQEKLAKTPNINADERARLEAELRLYEVAPSKLDDWMKKLKDIPLNAREAIASELIATAAADGQVHADEVKKLEFLFKRMGLDNKVLYDRLHDGAQRRLADNDGLSMIIPPGDRAAGSPIPPAPSDRPTTKIDATLLNSIRSETRITASVLADIFTDDDATEEAITVDSAPEPEIRQDELFEGLEQRYGSLLRILVDRNSWSLPDFERVVKEAGLMPGAAREAINDWSLDRFDELLLEGDDPVDINVYLLPQLEAPPSNSQNAEGIST